jgi:hypothetical protein
MLTEQTTTEDITVLADGTIKVRQKRTIFDDGVVIFERTITKAIDPADTDSKDEGLIAIAETRIAAATKTVGDKKRARPQP